MKTTNLLVDSYLVCPHKAHFLADGKHGQKHEYERITTQSIHHYHQCASAALAQRYGVESKTDFALLTNGRNHRAKLLLDPTIEHIGSTYRFDALVRGAGKHGGSRMYPPVVYRARAGVSSAERILLAFCARLLVAVQGQTPTSGYVVSGPGFRSTSVRLHREVGSAIELGR